MSGPFAASCNRGDALTWGLLQQLWVGVADDTPILVAHSDDVADWAQGADVLAAPDGPVARVHAPFAKQSQPPPGTRWSPAAVMGHEPGS